MRALAAPLIAGIVLASSTWAPPARAQTTVGARRPVDIDDDRVSLDTAALGADPDDALLQAAGASLVHDGGPLAPARPMVRGLGGARLGVDVGGLDLADPATGLVDAAFLPWSAADALVVETGAGAHLAGDLHLSLWRGRGGPPGDGPAFRGRVMAGSLSTVRASLAAAEGGSVVAVDAGSTRGDFPFLPTSAVGKPGTVELVREDNDQKRASVLGATRVHGGDVTVDGVAFAGAHDGGIAGLAGSPPLHLRGDDGLVGGRLVVSRSVVEPGDDAGASGAPASGGGRGARIAVSVDGRAAHRGSSDESAALDARPDAVDAISGGASVAITGIALDFATIEVSTGADDAALVDGRFARQGASGAVLARSSIGPVRTRLGVDARALTGIGPLWGGEARAEIGDDARFSLGVARQSRAPTLDELYAPRGLVLGNEKLRPEAADDVEAAFAFVPERVIDARIVGFAGILEDGIAFVNKNAFNVEPVNLGRAWRAGIDVSMVVEPNDFMRLEAAAEALASRVDATAAPLPLAPPFSSRIAIRLGQEAGPSVTAALRSRGAAPSNIFGTLKAAPYHLLDLVSRAPLGERLSVGVALENVLDVRDARDANQLPLPGRLVFVSLEVHT